MTGERRRTEEELADRRQAGRRSCAARSTALKTEVSQMRARKESLEEVLAHRTYTTEIGEAPVRGAGKGQGRRPQAAGRAGRFRGSGSTVRKARGRVPARRAGIRGGAELAAGRARPGFHPRRTGRPRHLPGASRAERAQLAALPEPTIGPETGIVRAAQRFACGSPTDSRTAPRICCRASRCVSWPRIGTRRSAWR